MRKLLILALLLLAPAAHAACVAGSGTFVGRYQYCGGTFDSTLNEGTTVTVTYSPTAGSGVLVISNWGGNNTFSTPATQTVTSIQNQSSSTLTCFVASPGTRYQLNAPGPDDEGWVAYFCPSIDSGVTGIKVNYSATVFFAEVYIFEFRGGDFLPSSFWNIDASAVTSSAGLSHSVSVSNTNTNALVIGYMHNGDSDGPPFPAVTGAAGWTTLTTSPSYPANNNFQVQAVRSTDSRTASITWSTTNEQGFGIIAAINAADLVDLATQAEKATQAELPVQTAF